MSRLLRILGSLRLAVVLLVLIAGVLAYGTLYEARFGTAAVQHFVYTAWWFQLLLAFLAFNLAVAALARYPWKRVQLPFLLAHLGIILILVGGILGGRFGVDGRMVIPEGQAQRTLEMSNVVLVVHDPASGRHAILPTSFEAQAWRHEPRLRWPVRFDGRAITLTVDRYFPDAVMTEVVADTGSAENPAVHLLLEHGEEREDVWLLARDPERFGASVGEAHVLFLEPQSETQLAQLTGKTVVEAAPRGTITLTLPGLGRPVEVPVPSQLNMPVPVKGSPYQVTFKDYFPDFIMTPEGLGTRSTQPNNPAVSFVLHGPEGDDAYLLFALHPDFQSMHGFKHAIAAQASYAHAGSGGALPPNSIALVRAPSGELMAVLSDEANHRQVIRPVAVGASYAHPAMPYRFQVAAYYSKAQVTQQVTNRSDELRAEAVHVTVWEEPSPAGGPSPAHETGSEAEGWVLLRNTIELALKSGPVVVEYRPAQRELPMTIKLLDFRKIDYPGTQMAAAFEADVELTDSARGVILMRKISMNNPLRYRGYSFFQSSYIPGPTETTVLSVRNDPGTPFVYAGFLIVIGGVVSLFLLRRNRAPAAGGTRTAGRKKGRTPP